MTDRESMGASLDSRFYGNDGIKTGFTVVLKAIPALLISRADVVAKLSNIELQQAANRPAIG